MSSKLRLRTEGVWCCSMLQYVAVCCSVLQCVAVQVGCNYWCELQIVAQDGRDVVLQCVAVCCSMLQCVVVCCSVLQCRLAASIGMSSKLRPRTEGVWCCSTLQYVAVCCSTLQYAAVRCSALQYVAVCCSVLQCVAVQIGCNYWCELKIMAQDGRYVVLQCVAVRCSVLQCVAVCCSARWLQLFV